MKHLFEQIVDELLKEQETAPNSDATETDNIESVYTPEQQKFLAVFGERGTTHLGLLYSNKEIGVQEFLTRAGATMNLTPDVFTSLLQTGVISVVPIESHSSNDMYTLQLNIPLAHVSEFQSGLTKSDGSGDAPAGGDTMPAPSGGGGGGGMSMPIPSEEIPSEEAPAEEEPVGEVPEEAPEEIPVGGPEESFRTDGELIVEHESLQIYNYQSILLQTVNAAKTVLNSNKLYEAKIQAKSGRVINRLPSGYVFYLEKIIAMLAKKTYTKLEKEHLVADIMDNLAYNFGLTPNQILRSYVFFKNQNRLINILKK